MQQRGFSLEQTDPIEAKCASMHILLQRQSKDPLKSIIALCMTREKILICHQLYGMHFQYHYPILHLPTHKFLDASPKLLLAMVLAGAYYSNNLIPVSEISKFALRLITLIENQQVLLSALVCVITDFYEGRNGSGSTRLRDRAGICYRPCHISMLL